MKKEVLREGITSVKYAADNQLSKLHRVDPELADASSDRGFRRVYAKLRRDRALST